MSTDMIFLGLDTVLLGYLAWIIATTPAHKPDRPLRLNRDSTAYAAISAAIRTGTLTDVSHTPAATPTKPEPADQVPDDRR